MGLQEQFRDALERADADLMMRIWQHAFPHLPMPRDRDGAVTALHLARTLAESIPLRLRAYSHRWLLDRGFPSQLPDHLKPSAERLYPKVARAVGISVNFKAPELAPAAALIRREMENSVNDSVANGDSDAITKERMLKAGARERKKLFGRFLAPT